MRTHRLKSVNPFFSDVWCGDKTFEVRFNDRDFKVGDFLLLKKYDPITEKYLIKEILCKVKYILDDTAYVKEGFVIMGIEIIDRI